MCGLVLLDGFNRMSGNSKNLLNRHGVFTEEDLLSVSEGVIYSWRGVGEIWGREICDLRRSIRKAYGICDSPVVSGDTSIISVGRSEEILTKRLIVVLRLKGVLTMSDAKEFYEGGNFGELFGKISRGRLERFLRIYGFIG